MPAAAMKPVQKLKAIPADPLTEKLREILIGQDEAIKTIVPFIQMHQAGLSPEGRPIGVILLLGPTGTGKTRTVEALAEAIYGNPRALVRIDCAEFQHSHEIAKLIGSPPGYLGHRETHPALSQAVLNHFHTDRVKLSFVVFDEIEKASDALWNLLLGIMDKGTLTLGDNSRVNFEQTFIFLTSNLGGKAIQKANGPGYGFESATGRNHQADSAKLRAIGIKAARGRFTPEFINRIDATITYAVLTREAFCLILGQLLAAFAERLFRQLELRTHITHAARDLLLDLGTSVEFGARELKRTVQRHLIQPVAARVSRGEIPAGSTVVLDAKDGEFQIFIRQ